MCPNFSIAWHQQEDSEVAGDLEGCEKVYEQASSSMQSLADQVCSIEAVRENLALKAGESDAGESLLQALPPPGEPQNLRMRFGLFDMPAETDQAASSVNPGARPGGRAKQVHKLASQSMNPLGSTKRPRRSGSPDATPMSSIDLPGNPAGASQTKKTLEIMRKARETLQKQDAALSDNAMWGSKIRKRVVDAAVKALSNHAATLLATNDHEAAMLSSQINEWCDKAEIRFQALQAVRSRPLEFAGTAADEMVVHMETLKTMQVPMLSNIILYVAGECLKLLDKDLLSG